MTRIPLTLVAVLFAGGALAQQVGPAPVAVTKSEPAAYALVAPDASVAAHRHTLAAPDDAEFAALRANNLREKRLQIGFARPLPDSLATVVLDALAWQTLADGSRVARLEIRSPGASAIRAAFERRALPKGLTIRAYAPGEHRIAHAPLRAGLGGRVSLPEQRGDILGLELHAALGFDWRGAVLPIAAVSHLAASPVNWNAKDLAQLGDAGSCNLDIACHPDANWTEVAKAVAKYTFDSVDDEGDPGTFLCTGTLVNNLSNDGSPLFTTANHCIESDAEAQTMTFYWHFERATCGGAAPTGGYVSANTTTGGADLLATAAANDMVLLLLSQTPAPDSLLSGWNANTPQRSGAVTSIHHPAGDLKKYADGTLTDFTEYSSGTHTANGSHLRVLWGDGTTEGGSSGAGLFNGAYEFIGTLHGGGASCSAQTEPDWYGRLDQAYDTFDAWLESGSGGSPPPTPPTVTPIVNGDTVHDELPDGEWHYYSIELPNADLNRIETWLTVFSGDADLYLREGELPTETHYGCRSWESGVTDEYCDASDSTTPSDWYVGVYAYEGEVSYALEVELSRDPPVAPPPPPVNNSGGGGHGGLLIAIGLLGWWRHGRGNGKSVQIPAGAGMGHAEGRRQGPEIR
ncbi:MAG: trypsin-like peptidase domain-containing protein [Gammaproteobacteria bacterium]